MGLLDRYLNRSGARRGRMGQPAAATGRDRDDNGALIDRRSVLGPMGFGFCGLLIVAVVLVLDYGVLPPPLQVQDLARSDYVARQAFSYMDLQYIQDQRDRADEEAPWVFNEVPRWPGLVLADLKHYCEIGDTVATYEDYVAVANPDPADRTLINQLWQYKQEQERRVTTPEDKASILKNLHDRLVSKLQSVQQRYGVISIEHAGTLWQKKGEKTIIRLGTEGGLHRVSVERLMAPDRAQQAIENILGAMNFSVPLRRALEAYFFSGRLKPSLEFNTEATVAEQHKARERVPRTSRKIKEGSTLLAKGQVIRPWHLKMIHEEALAYKAGLSWMDYVQRFLGLCAVVGAILFLCVLGLRRLQPKLLRRRRPLVMLALSCLAVLIVSKIFLLHQDIPNYLAPVAFVTIIASLAFSQSVALIVGIALSILVGAAAGGDLFLMLTLMVGSTVAALPASKLEERWDLIEYGLLGGAAQLCVAAGVTLLRGSGALNFSISGFMVPGLFDAGWAFLNGVICGVAVLALLPVIEMIYGIITNIRLYELADPTQPALRRIQEHAPGTWAHTLGVITLAEQGTEAIGANTRLVRAGVSYHDLGKTLKPEYFVENMMGAEERHKRLAPSVSALIITSHVKDGIELAKEYHLPKQIIDFIPEHHGTTLVSFFYHSERKRAEAEREAGGGSGEVQEGFFRYPGPKPQSRETAIVLMADTIDAATRTLDNPTPRRLRQFVHELMMGKLLDGQLDECDLTFRDLAVLEEVFVRVLVSRFHGRIKYPEQDSQFKKADQSKSDVRRQAEGGKSSARRRAVKPNDSGTTQKPNNTDPSKTPRPGDTTITDARPPTENGQAGGENKSNGETGKGEGEGDGGGEKAAEDGESQPAGQPEKTRA